jgi:hypothetical protein
VLCGPMFGTPLDGVCNFAGVPGAHGTCLPPDLSMGFPGGGEVGLCSQGGSTLVIPTPYCTPGLTRGAAGAGLDNLCPAGMICAARGNPNAACYLACNPMVPDSCLPSPCFAVDPADAPLLGACGGYAAYPDCVPVGGPCVEYGSCCSFQCQAGFCVCSPPGTSVDNELECCSGSVNPSALCPSDAGPGCAGICE